MTKQIKVADVLSLEERNGILAICALNKLEGEREIYRKVRIGKLNISFHWRSSKHLWGRFGGGWQWALGFEVAKRTLNLKCLIFNIMIWGER